MPNAIRKAVFPVAGMGQRFLPATKANPKEMMPIVDKPLIQYAVEEAVSAGITEIIFVTSSSKGSIEDHFDTNFELEETLKKQGKEELLHMVQNILPKGVSCVYVRQSAPLGLGHAVLCAKDIVGDEPFGLILADDLINGFGTPCLKQMVKKYSEVKSSIIAIQEVNSEDCEKYGIVGFDSNTKDIQKLERIIKIVEKPILSQAPSLFGVVGRYILTPSIFSLIEKLSPGRNNEIQLTDAISQLLEKESVYAYQFEGKRYDCGDKLGYLQAIVSYGIKHKDVGDDFKRYLKNISLDA